MALVTFPTSLRAPSQMRWRPIYNVQIHQSRFTRSISTAELPGRTFYGEFLWENLIEAEIAVIEAFYGRLRGAANRFYFTPPHRKTPRGAARTGTHTPLVMGSAQTGLSLVTDGWSPNITNILLEGDYIAFDNSAGYRELKIVTANVSSNGSGQVTIPIDDPIRASPADNTPILFNPPSAYMMLYEQSQEDAGIDIEAPILGSWKMTCMEAL